MSARISETDLILNKDGSLYHLNLKPGDIAPIILTVGDPGRVHRISRHFDTVDFEMNKREFITHTGKYKGKRITVISSGMGTDNVEVLMTELDALVNMDFKEREWKEKRQKLYVIRVGTSGSIQEDVRLGTHVVSEYGVGLDTLMSFYNLQLDDFEKEVGLDLQKYIGLNFTPYCVRGSDILFNLFRSIGTPGNTLTCPGFYAPQGRNMTGDNKFPDLESTLNYFHNDAFWLTNIEMETAGYYGLARIMGHEALSVNAIIANRIRKKFSKDPNRIIDSMIRKVLDIIASSDL